MPLEKIKKRNGSVVDFDRTRIERAIGKAFIDVQVQVSEEKIVTMTDTVVVGLDRGFEDRVAGVEDIQDLVERSLAENGFFDVAKSYILYRSEHEKQREEEQEKIVESIEKGKNGVHVTKRDGTLESFDITIVKRLFDELAREFPDTAKEAIIESVKRAVFDEMSTAEVNQAIVMACRGRIERDPMYSRLAAWVLFNDLYKDIIGMYAHEDGFETAYKATYITALEKGIESDRLDPRLLEFDMPRIMEAMKPERDKLFEYLGAQTLYDRYFMKNHDQEILETPQYFWMRVAMGLALDEPKEDWTDRALQFYEIYSELRYVSSTPTLFHSGTVHAQMSSCFLTTVDDDLNHIFKCIGDNGQLSKWSGGVANDWSSLRATGALIKSTNVQSQGVIPFLKIVDSTTAAINRSGKRRGATAVYLETWHYDVESFLNLRKNTGDDRVRTHDINTAHWIPDLFMKRVMNDEMWTLFSPDETPDLHHIYGKKFEQAYEGYEEKAKNGEIALFKQVRAKDMWRKMITMLFETGHPWVTFKDPSNVRSPQDHCGVVHSSNLCTEITLNTSADETAVCNLGSINLSRHIVDGKIDGKMLEETVHLAIRMLDNTVNLNFYPTKEAEFSNKKHRPVGLGIMGLHDALYKTGHTFDTEEAVVFSDEIMEFITYHGILTSSELAKERGAYESFPGSKWDRDIFPVDTLDLLEKERGSKIDVNRTVRMDWSYVRNHVQEHGMRNSNCFAIAPTATIANISGVLPGIEPIYKNIYTKSNFSGEFTVINKYLVEELKQLGMWNPEMLAALKHFDGSVQSIDSISDEMKAMYKEVFEINTIWLIKHAAVRGKWIDQSQSVNIFTSSTSGRVLSDTYFAAWEQGLKTTYYLRSLGATSVEKSTIDINKEYGKTDSAPSASSGQEGSPQADSETVLQASSRQAAPEVVAVSETITETVTSSNGNGTTATTETISQSAAAAAVCSILNGEDCESCQ